MENISNNINSNCLRYCNLFFYSIAFFSCTTTTSTQLGELGVAMERFVFSKLQENIRMIDNPSNSHIVQMRPRSVNDIRGVEGTFNLVSDLKKDDGKELRATNGDITYEMDFSAIINVESSYFDNVVTNETDIDFWGVNFHYSSTSEVTPEQYIFIKGVAYYELKESGWVFKDFIVVSAQPTAKDKISDLK